MVEGRMPAHCFQLRLSVLLAALAVPVSVAHAQLSFQSATRSLRIQIFTEQVQDSTTQLGTWNQTLEMNHSSGLGWARVVQNSIVSPSGISLTASCNGWHQNGGETDGRNEMTAVFSVESPIEYVVNAAFNTGIIGFGYLRLTGPGGAISFEQGGSRTYSGLLNPGVYTFEYSGRSLDSNGGVPPSNSSCSFTLTVPAPGGAALVFSAALLATRRRRATPPNEPR
jgi:hypothetical protein